MVIAQCLYLNSYSTVLIAQYLSHSTYSTLQKAQLFFLASLRVFFLASLRVFSQQISTAKEKNSTDAFAAFARSSISGGVKGCYDNFEKKTSVLVERGFPYSLMKLSWEKLNNACCHQAKKSNFVQFVQIAFFWKPICYTVANTLIYHENAGGILQQHRICS